ncbi:MAG: hypothetical protein HKN36_11415 [Hellea sp.]|nr:hypothetical protein [Hellea sp.]
MNSQNIFEIFNHFLETRDPSQLMELANDVEVFGSATFGDGRVYIGEKAPEKFRETISLTRVSKPNISVQIKHALVEGNHGIFFLNILKGRKTLGSALDVVISDGKLKCFHEVKSKSKLVQ